MLIQSVETYSNVEETKQFCIEFAQCIDDCVGKAQIVSSVISYHLKHAICDSGKIEEVLSQRECNNSNALRSRDESYFYMPTFDSNSKWNFIDVSIFPKFTRDSGCFAESFRGCPNICCLLCFHDFLSHSEVTSAITDSDDCFISSPLTSSSL